MFFANANEAERSAEQRKAVCVSREQIDQLYLCGRKFSPAFADLQPNDEVFAKLPQDGVLDHLVTTESSDTIIKMGDIEATLIVSAQPGPT